VEQIYMAVDRVSCAWYNFAIGKVYYKIKCCVMANLL